MLSRRQLFPAVALAVVPVLAAAGPALAQGNRPRTEIVSGMFTGSPVNAMQRTCTGEDGVYLEIRGHFAGAITSTDPRLAGDLEFMAEPALVNLTTGFGTFRGRFRVHDPVTNQQKAEGQFFSVVTEGSLNHAFAVGKVRSGGTGGTDEFFASFTSTFDAGLNVTGQYGGSGDPRTPAVVQGGQCSGPFTKVP